MESLTHLLTFLTGIIAKSHWVLFIIMMIESTSLPSIIPAEIILITAGYWVGKGHTFEMWNPDLFDEYFKKSREISLKNRNVLKFAS